MFRKYRVDDLPDFRSYAINNTHEVKKVYDEFKACYSVTLTLNNVIQATTALAGFPVSVSGLSDLASDQLQEPKYAGLAMSRFSSLATKNFPLTTSGGKRNTMICQANPFS